jgi:hypothetical protein
LLGVSLAFNKIVTKISFPLVNLGIPHTFLLILFSWENLSSLNFSIRVLVTFIKVIDSDPNPVDEKWRPKKLKKGLVFSRPRGSFWMAGCFLSLGVIGGGLVKHTKQYNYKLSSKFVFFHFHQDPVMRIQNVVLRK